MHVYRDSTSIALWESMGREGGKGKNSTGGGGGKGKGFPDRTYLYLEDVVSLIGGTDTGKGGEGGGEREDRNVTKFLQQPRSQSTTPSHEGDRIGGGGGGPLRLSERMVRPEGVMARGGVGRGWGGKSVSVTRTHADTKKILGGRSRASANGTRGQREGEKDRERGGRRG